MKIVGLTGGTGSGKSLVCAYLLKKNAFIIDCDKISREILLPKEPAYKEVVEYFGNDILDEKGFIIRKKLGDIVFSNKEKIDFLNECTHKYIVLEIENQIKLVNGATDKYSFIVIDAPLLIEANLIKICHMVWVVFAHEDERLKRIVERDLLTIEQAKNRINSQLSWKEYKKYADYVIENTKDLKFVENQIDDLIEMLKNKY